MPTPLLILSDAVTSGTGLGRIARDLAVRIAEHMPDVFRVGTLGYGGLPSRNLPFVQYPWQPNSEWIVYELPEVWKDFAGDEKGIVMTIWDASRLLWFARPENCQDKQLQKFLQNPPFKRWGYWPIDATGPNDKLTAILAHTITGYDRCLAYSKWARDILGRTLSDKDASRLDLDWRPHGIDTSIFFPRPRTQARHGFGARLGIQSHKGKPLSIADDAFLIGIVATNQTRKDWGLGIAACAEIAKERPVRLWLHTDMLERHWSIPALLNDFGLTDKAIISIANFSDEQMAWNYSACDVTLGIGLGEGFGYPIFESLACGTPCIHGNYGGAAEHMPQKLLVECDDYPIEPMMRIEGPYNCMRPVYYPDQWARRMNHVFDHVDGVGIPAHLDWTVLWSAWEKWFRRGL